MASPQGVAIQRLSNDRNWKDLFLELNWPDGHATLSLAMTKAFLKQISDQVILWLYSAILAYDIVIDNRAAHMASPSLTSP